MRGWINQELRIKQQLLDIAHDYLCAAISQFSTPDFQFITVLPELLWILLRSPACSIRRTYSSCRLPHPVG